MTNLGVAACVGTIKGPFFPDTFALPFPLMSFAGIEADVAEELVEELKGVATCSSANALDELIS